LDSDLNHKLAMAMGSFEQASSYYGMAIFESETYKKFLEVFSHPDYQKVVYPFEHMILDCSRSQVVAGQFATFVDRNPQQLKVSHSITNH
jgi:hypothetical protein